VQPDKLYSIFARNLKTLRKDRGWSQEDLAKAMSDGRSDAVFVPYISDLERCVKKPSMETLARLSEVFEVEPADLISERELSPA